MTIIGMALVTYATRTNGFLLLRNRKLSPRARAVLDVAPGCVLIAAIAPHFVSPHPEKLLALAITIAAAWKRPMLVIVAAGVSSLALFKYLLSS
ncbi:MULTISPECIES: AzlD domain-containing protein [unclassified Pseudomonas]